MDLRSSLVPFVFSVALVVVSCNQTGTENSPTTTAIGSDSASVSATRLFDRRHLAVSGFHNLNEFIRPEIRERLDQEPTGSIEDGFVPPTVVNENPGEAPESGLQEAYSEENPSKELEVENIKFSWAKRKFGDLLAANQNTSGVIVLYADENLYDISRLVYFIEEGRARIAADSQIDPGRIQVVYGGYRGVPQVECWVVAAGQEMPAFKPEDRDGRPDNNN